MAKVAFARIRFACQIIFLSWCANVSSQINQSSIWKVETDDGTMFIRHWGFQPTARLNIGLVPFDSSLLAWIRCRPEIDLDPDQVTRVTDNFEGLRIENQLLVTLRNGTKCLSKGGDSAWELATETSNLRIRPSGGSLFEDKVPVTVVLPSSRILATTWLKRSNIRDLTSVSMDAAVAAEAALVAASSTEQRDRAPAASLSRLQQRVAQDLDEWRTQLHFYEPLTNCGEVWGVFGSLVEVSYNNVRYRIPRETVFPLPTACDELQDAAKRLLYQVE